MRLRSFATPIAVAAFVAAAFFWIPDPKGNATSLSWELPDGRVQAPVYSAAYVGFAVSVLSGIILAMGGFYLVAGSVRRDRERGVGAILAATPLSKTAYLGGKLAAHFVVSPGARDLRSRCGARRVRPVRRGALLARRLRAAVLPLGDPGDRRRRRLRRALRRDAGPARARRPRDLVLRLPLRPRQASARSRGRGRRRSRGAADADGPAADLRPDGPRDRPVPRPQVAARGSQGRLLRPRHSQQALRARALARNRGDPVARRHARSQPRPRPRSPRFRDSRLRPLRPRALPPDESGGQVSNLRMAPKTEKTRPDPGSFRFGGGEERGT